jgi:hypothetical protein
MTSILNFSSTSSSAQAGSVKEDSAKFPTTFIVQPQIKTNSLLAKRCKPVNLGDMLSKKLKTSSGSNSSDQSPVLKSSFDDAVYDSSEVLECHSAIEGVRSPSSHLSSQDANKMNDETTVPECLIPQRSFSTPIIPTALSFGAAKNKIPDGQKQIQNALETLQKRMLLEQQAFIIRDIIKRVQFSQDILRIPALNSESNDVESPCSAEITREQLKKVLTRGEEDPEIIIGEIEYPLLSMAPPSTNSKRSTLAKINPPKRGKKANAKNSLCSSPDSEDDDENESLLDSLTVTRAETQRSDSEIGESVAKITDGGKKKGKKESAPRKNLKKEKTSRQANNKGLLSPLMKERKMTERKKNKWQDTELNVKIF